VTADLRTELELATPPGFRLDPTVRGHGWYDLPPFAYTAGGALSFLHLAGDEVLEIQVREAPGGVRLAVRSAAAPPGAATTAAAAAVTREVLGLDEDLEPFYRLLDGDPAYAWVRPAGAGRLLRAPTVFEDLVKLICTTNCAWSATRRMVGALVETLGARAASGRRAFPSPARMAAEPESFYRDVVRAGYRAQALRELALKAAREPEALERLRRVDWASAELRRALLALRGVGPYAAEHLLRLLGRHDFLAVDSWCVTQFARQRGRRRPATPRALERAYARFGAYRGLAMWLDLTRDWECHGGAAEWPAPAAQGSANR
jgi:N-glycosylase/DNA lyase